MTDVKDTKTLTLDGALKVLNAAIAEATQIGQPMCIAVVAFSATTGRAAPSAYPWVIADVASAFVYAPRHGGK
jgi:uncharacterized protein GlcG (DUF336 family)